MFLFSKILWSTLEPLNLFLIALMIGLVLAGTRRYAVWGRRLMVSVIVLTLVPTILPLEQWGGAVLENRFAFPDPLPDKVDGIIILGGGIDPAMSEAHHQVAVNGAITRLTAAVPLARRYPNAKIIFTGGSGHPRLPELKEAAYAKAFYEDIGFDTSRVIFEDWSRNTRENALYSKQLAEPKPGETWLLITSAFHMPRSVGCFRAVGWPVVPYPVHYQTLSRDDMGWSDLRFSVGAGIGGLSSLAHEALGLAYYRLRGWTDTLIPGP